MKALDLTDITATVRMPLKEGTLEFMQLSWAEQAQHIKQSMIGPGYDVTKVYILWGVVKSTTSGSDAYTEGALFYNGEIYHVQASVITPSGSAVVNFVQYQYSVNADPVTFTDSSTHSIHDIREGTVVAGASGTGTLTGNSKSDYGNLVRLHVDNSAWTSVSLTVTAPGGSVGGTTVYSKFKLIGKTLFWNIRMTGVTFGTTTSYLVVAMNPALGTTYVNIGSVQATALLNGTTPLLAVLQATDVNINVYNSGGGGFTPGTGNYLDISIVAEVN